MIRSQSVDWNFIQDDDNEHGVSLNVSWNYSRRGMLLINQRKLNTSLISKSKTGLVCVRVSEFSIKYQAQGVIKSS